MKIGLNIISMRADEIGRSGEVAEACGYDSVWLGEHIVLPHAVQETYPVKPPPYGPQEFLDIFAILGFIAARTKRIRLATGVMLLPLRGPIPAARGIVGIDILSGGRFDLGVGLGWAEDEFNAAGTDIHTRGARMDEMLKLFDMLWSQENIAYQGKFYSIRPTRFDPKPVQKPRPPVYIGGVSEPALRRAARWDGWYAAVPTSPEHTKAQIDVINRERRVLGRDKEPFTCVMCFLDGPPREVLDAYAAIGIDRFVVTPWGYDHDNALRRIESYAKALGLF